MTAFTIRPSSPGPDAAAVFQLWADCLGQVWPVEAPLFHGVLTEHPSYREGDHFVAERAGEILGFASTQVQRGEGASRPAGGIGVLLVHPRHRRQGIGTALHDAALEHLRRMGMRRAQIAGGGSSRFWPGVPCNLPEALAFFRARGWKYTERSYDLVMHLREYRTPEGISERAARERIEIRVATEAEVGALLEFEAREFPAWLEGLRHTAGVGDVADILAAWDASGRVVGTLLMFTPQSRCGSASVVWRTLLGEDMGGLGAVGVAAGERNRGIGTALVAGGTEILRERGVGHSHIGWTWLLDFYGRLGYRPWQQYQMSWRELG